MVGVAIVAIPSQDDYVWKISSEKVPHMTLLFLGDLQDQQALTHIENYISHVVEVEGYRFGLSVESRGELGPDQADVVFFRKGDAKHNVDRIRNGILSDSVVRQAYNSTEQYPEWTPHLTLGYPTAPAHPDNRDYPGIQWVNFDKLAFWIGEYDGPEFRLRDREEVSLAMSDRISQILEHATKAKAAKVSSKAWSDYSSADYTVQQWDAACLIHQHTGPSTSKNQCKLPVRTPDGVLNSNAVHAAAAALAGARGGVIASADQKAKAAKELIKLYGELNEKPPPSLLQHSGIDDLGAAILEHHGVKGMKWGVRKDRITGAVSSGKEAVKKEVAARTGEAVVVRTKPGAGVRTVGGNKRPAHADAVTARVNEQIVKRSSLDALSNKDLQSLVTRMNLEAQYRNLAVNEDRRSTGEKFAEKLLTEDGGAIATKLKPIRPIVDIGLKEVGIGNKAFDTGQASSKKKS